MARIITKSLSVKLIEKNSIKVIIDSAKLIEKSGSLITGVTFTYVDAPVKRKPRTVKEPAETIREDKPS